MKIGMELEPCCGTRSGIGNYVYELARRLEPSDGLEFYGRLFRARRGCDHAALREAIPFPVEECRSIEYGLYRRIWDWVPVPYQRCFATAADLNLFLNYIVPPRVSGRVITAIYDMTYLRYPETMQRKNYRRIRAHIEESIARSDHILTISEFSKREILELLHVPEESVSVVAAAPSLPQQPRPFAEVGENYQIQKPYLLYLGNLEPRKNLARLLKAFAYLKTQYHIPHRLVLAGGNRWRNQAYESLLRGLRLGDAVIETGFVSDPEKRTLYENAALFVFPSLYEGFGMPPLEAMACGCPVACSNAAALPEIVDDAACLFDPLDEKAIAEAVWRVLYEEGYAQSLAERGSRRARMFQWETSAEKLKELCREVLR